MLSALLWNCKVSNRRPLKHPVRWLLSSTNESNLPERGRCSLVLFMLMRTVVRIDDDLKLFQAFEGTFTTASHRDEFNFCCFGQAFWRVPVPVGPSRGCCIFMYWCILTVFLLYSYSILTVKPTVFMSFSKLRKVEDLVVSARMLSLRSAQVLALYEYAAAQFILDPYMILLLKKIRFLDSFLLPFRVETSLQHKSSHFRWLNS